MIWRCKHGDLAVIINETPKCRGNIGLIVQVRGPLKYLGIVGLYGWTIKPLHKQKILVQMYEDADAEFQAIYWKHPRCIPDAWLLPIRPKDDDLDVSDAEELLKSVNLKECLLETYSV